MQSWKPIRIKGNVEQWHEGWCACCMWGRDFDCHSTADLPPPRADPPQSCPRFHLSYAAQHTHTHIPAFVNVCVCANAYAAVTLQLRDALCLVLRCAHKSQMCSVLFCKFCRCFGNDSDGGSNNNLTVYISDVCCLNNSLVNFCSSNCCCADCCKFAQMANEHLVLE